MPPRNDNLTAIVEFLRRRYNDSLAVIKQMESLDNEQRMAVVAQGEKYTQSIKNRYTVKEIAEELDMTYSAVRYVLAGKYDADIVHKRQPEELRAVGIVTNYRGKGIKFIDYSWSPDMLLNYARATNNNPEMNGTSVAEVVKPAQPVESTKIIEVEKECTKEHWSEGMMWFRKILRDNAPLGVTESGAFVNRDGDPVVGLYPLTATELEVIRAMHPETEEWYQPQLNS